MEHGSSIKSNELFGKIVSWGIALVFLIFSWNMVWKFSEDPVGKGIWIFAATVLEMAGTWFLVPRIKRAWKNRRRVLSETQVEAREFIFFGPKVTLTKKTCQGFWKTQALIMLLASCGVQGFSLTSALSFSVNDINSAVEQAQLKSTAITEATNTGKDSTENLTISTAQSTIASQSLVIATQTEFLKRTDISAYAIKRAQEAVQTATDAITQANKDIQTAAAARDKKSVAKGEVKVDNKSKIKDTFQQVADFLKGLSFGLINIDGPKLLTGLFLFAFLFLMVAMWLSWKPLDDETAPVPEIIKTPEEKIQDDAERAEEELMNNLLNSAKQTYEWSTLEKYLMIALPEEGNRMISDPKVSEMTGIPLALCYHFKTLLKTRVWEGKTLVKSWPGKTEMQFTREGIIKVMKFFFKAGITNVTKEEQV